MTTEAKKQPRRKLASKQRANAPNGQPEAVEQAAGIFALIERLSPAKVILFICLFCSLAYANSLGGQFVFDDTDQVVDNRDIRSWDNLKRAFVTHVWAFRERPDILRAPIPPPYYRPVFTVMLTVEYQLFGLWPQGWHLVSLLLHILCSIGVYYVLLMVSRKKHIALISALLFSIFPIHAESVSWISGMTDPLYGASFLASFYFYLRFREGNKRSHLWLSLGIFTVSAFSKETALSLVFLVFAYELIESLASRSDSGSRLLEGLVKAAKRALPFAVVVIFYLIPRYLALGGLTWKNFHAHEGPFTDTLLTLPSVIWAYLTHLAWPVGLSIAYETSFVTVASSPRFLLPAAALAILSGGLIIYRKRISKEVWHALALTFVPLLPVLDLRQLSVEYLIFDRYLYLSVMGWTYLIALGLAKLASSGAGQTAKSPAGHVNRPSWQAKLSFTIFIVMSVGLTALTARENLNWADSYSLWSNAARVRPTFWAAHYNAGLALMEAKRFDEARDVLLRAASLAPEEPFVFDALGRTYSEIGDRTKAVESFKRAIEIDPATFESFNNLGNVYFKAGDYREAERQFIAALRLKPQASPSRFNLGLCYSRQGRYIDAAREFEKVIEAVPDDAEAYYELGIAFEKVGRTTDAILMFQRGIAVTKSQELADKINEGISRIQSESRSGV